MRRHLPILGSLQEADEACLLNLEARRVNPSGLALIIHAGTRTLPDLAIVNLVQIDKRHSLVGPFHLFPDDQRCERALSALSCLDSAAPPHIGARRLKPFGGSVWQHTYAILHDASIKYTSLPMHQIILALMVSRHDRS